MLGCWRADCSSSAVKPSLFLNGEEVKNDWMDEPGMLLLAGQCDREVLVSSVGEVKSDGSSVPPKSVSYTSEAGRNDTER